MSNIFKVNERSNWSTNNPVLLPGEVGFESVSNNIKVGNGRSNWNQLPYFASPGYWGSFWDETSQTATVNTPTSVLLRSTDTNSRGINIVNQSRMTFDHAGVYSIIFSIQLNNIDTQIHDVDVWLRKNDSGASGDVPASDSRFSVIASHGGTPGNIIGAVNFVLKLAANDYIELMWATSNVNAYIHAEGAQTSPFAHPSIPGVICTATQVASA